MKHQQTCGLFTFGIDSSGFGSYLKTKFPVESCNSSIGRCCSIHVIYLLILLKNVKEGLFTGI